MSKLAGSREATIGDLGAKLRPGPDRPVDRDAGDGAARLRQGIEPVAQHHPPSERDFAQPPTPNKARGRREVIE
jgi:hypothetical protein